MKQLLLHTCCAPCSIIPFDVFSDEGYAVTAAYVNPNIHPREEYDRRLAVLKEYADVCDRGVFEAEYDPQQWELAVGSLGGPYPLVEDAPDFARFLELRRERCRRCYRLRFEQVAEMAAEQGFEDIATTLTISPYQFTDIIFEELDAAASKQGLRAALIDFQMFYPEATRRSRELGMYRQNYCGCRFSQEEAHLEREARKKDSRNKKR